MQRWYPLACSALVAGWSCVAFAQQGNDIVILSLADGQLRELVDEAGMNCGSPRWSPNDEWIAYDTAPCNNNDRSLCRVLKIRADGSERTDLGAGGMPTWAPDGRSLAWHTYLPSATVVSRDDGGGVEPITDHWGNPCWMRNPRYILSVRRSDLSACDLHTGTERIVLRPRYSLKYGYSISPDDHLVSYRTYDGYLIVAELDTINGVQRRRIDRGNVEYSSWSPDGSRLVVSWQAPGESTYQLYTLSAEGDDIPKLVIGQQTDRSNLQPDWSSDGEYLVYRRVRASSTHE